MNRKTKLLIYILIICTFFIGVYFTQGYYLSKDKALADAKHFHYIDNEETLTTIDLDKQYIYLGADKNGKYMSMIYLDRIGPFYRYNDSRCYDMLNLPYINVSYGGSWNGTRIIYIYRNNKDVAYIEVELDTGEKFVLDNWINDYTYTYYKPEVEGFNYYEIKVYDASHKLLKNIGGSF